MEFLKALKETRESVLLKEELEELHDEGIEMYRPMTLIRSFEPLFLEDGSHLSIQASFAHYCWPRETVPVEEYEAMEMAYVNKDGLVSLREVIQDEALLEKTEEYFNDPIYSYIPVELIEEVYQTLFMDGKGQKKPFTRFMDQLRQEWTDRQED